MGNFPKLQWIYGAKIMVIKNGIFYKKWNFFNLEFIQMRGGGEEGGERGCYVNPRSQFQLREQQLEQLALGRAREGCKGWGAAVEHHDDKADI